MKYMVIINCYSGQETKRKLNEKCQHNALSFQVEKSSSSFKKYLVVRDYFTNNILQKIDVTKMGAMEFFVRNY